MRKADVLQQLRAERAELLAAIEGLDQNALLRPGAMGLWSVKDILAHLTAWESELVTALSRLDPNREPELLKIEDMDEWNAEQYSVNAPRPLELVLADFHGVHRHLIKMVEELDEPTLTSVNRFRWLEGEPLTYLIAENAFWHEREHAEEIRAWRAANGL